MEGRGGSCCGCSDGAERSSLLDSLAKVLWPAESELLIKKERFKA